MFKLKPFSSPAISRIARGLCRRANRNSPELFLVAGVVMGGAAIVSACKSTTELPETLNRCNVRLERARAIPLSNVYTEDDRKKAIGKAYVDNCVDVAKLYAVPAVLELTSVGMIVNGNRILRKRYSAAAVTCAAIARSFDRYRGGVREKFGEQADYELYYGAPAQTVVAEVVDEDGKVVETVEQATVPSDSPTGNPFGRWWSDSDEYVNDDWYAEGVFRGQQCYFTNKLRADRHIVLNRVYEKLGYEPTAAGYTHGWVYDPANEKDGGNTVNFRWTKMKRCPDPVNHPERIIDDYYLDFDVQGDISESMVTLKAIDLV